MDLKDRSLGSEDVAALAKLLSASNQVEILSLYNVRLGSEVKLFCLYRYIGTQKCSSLTLTDSY